MARALLTPADTHKATALGRLRRPFVFVRILDYPTYSHMQKKVTSIRQKQSIFALNVSKLIQYAFQMGYEVTLGEAYRTDDQQRIYVRKGLTKAEVSRHQQRLAIDLNLFIDGEYKTDSMSYSELALYWESLHPNNIAGYRWGWDANHFEMKPD